MVNPIEKSGSDGEREISSSHKGTRFFKALCVPYSFVGDCEVPCCVCREVAECFRAQLARAQEWVLRDRKAGVARARERLDRAEEELRRLQEGAGQPQS